jgi:ketosteroid isomerase-like protein
MSQRNVETVLEVYRAFRGRDRQSVLAVYDPDVEWNMDGYPAWPGKQSYRGVDGIEEFFRDWLHDFDGYEAEALDVLDLGDRVLVTVHDRARGKGSGVPIERHHAQVWSFNEEGRVTRIEVFESRDAALAAHRPSDQSTAQ